MRRKTLTIICVVVVQLVLACQQNGTANTTQPVGFIPMETVDMEKALANKWTSPVKHVLWPTDATIASKKYSGDVTVEKEELRDMLNKFLQEGYRPLDDDLTKGVVPLTELWDGSDYLLLRYTTKSGLRIDIQDGRNIFILVNLPNTAPLSEVESLVKNTAEAMFDLSGVLPENRDKPKIWTWSIDIGASRSGELRYGYSPKTNQPEWYTSIGWWSDGQRILFGLSKFNFKLLPEISGNIPIDPRKFSSRAQADTSNE